MAKVVILYTSRRSSSAVRGSFSRMRCTEMCTVINTAHQKDIWFQACSDLNWAAILESGHSWGKSVEMLTEESCFSFMNTPFSCPVNLELAYTLLASLPNVGSTSALTFSSLCGERCHGAFLMLSPLLPALWCRLCSVPYQTGFEGILLPCLAIFLLVLLLASLVEAKMEKHAIPWYLLMNGYAPLPSWQECLPALSSFSESDSGLCSCRSSISSFFATEQCCWTWDCSRQLQLWQSHSLM